MLDIVITDTTRYHLELSDKTKRIILENDFFDNYKKVTDARIKDVIFIYLKGEYQGIKISIDFNKMYGSERGMYIPVQIINNSRFDLKTNAIADTLTIVIVKNSFNMQFVYMGNPSPYPEEILKSTESNFEVKLASSNAIGFSMAMESIKLIISDYEQGAIKEKNNLLVGKYSFGMGKMIIPLNMDFKKTRVFE